MEFILQGRQTQTNGTEIDIEAHIHTGLGGLMHCSKIVDPTASAPPKSASTDPAGTLHGPSPVKATTTTVAPSAKIDVGGTLK